MSLLMPMSGLQFLIFLTGLQLILGSEKYNASVSVLATEEKISHPDGRKKGLFWSFQCVSNPKTVFRKLLFMR